jgi:hypothetical protein
MTSQITTSTIDATYPVAGQDNNSQGFRDNFNSIKTAFSVAKSEITDLQNNSAKLNTDNNFNGVLIDNAEVSRLYNITKDAGTITQNTNVTIADGTLQTFVLGADVTLTFAGWPDAGHFGQVRLHLKGDGVSIRTCTISTENNGTVIAEASVTTPVSLPTTQVEKVFEAWTYDAGGTVYLRYLGEY